MASASYFVFGGGGGAEFRIVFDPPLVPEMLFGIPSRAIPLFAGFCGGFGGVPPVGGLAICAFNLRGNQRPADLNTKLESEHSPKAML
jgi:hypothetical protein